MSSDGEAEMHVARIGGGIGIGRLARDLVVEEFEPDAAGKVDEGNIHRDTGIADMAAEIRPVEHVRAARLPAEKTLPERERRIEVGDAHADMVRAADGALDLRSLPSPSRASQIRKSCLGIPREHRRLLVLREAGDDLGIGVDQVRIGAEHAVDRPVGAEDDALRYRRSRSRT